MRDATERDETPRRGAPPDGEVISRRVRGYRDRVDHLDGVWGESIEEGRTPRSSAE